MISLHLTRVRCKKTPDFDDFAHYLREVAFSSGMRNIRVKPPSYSLVKSQAPLMFCGGGEGGVAQGLFVKSKNSVMLGIAASRAVSVGRFQRVSMKCK